MLPPTSYLSRYFDLQQPTSVDDVLRVFEWAGIIPTRQFYGMPVVEMVYFLRFILQQNPLMAAKVERAAHNYLTASTEPPPCFQTDEVLVLPRAVPVTTVTTDAVDTAAHKRKRTDSFDTE
jgi:hypothetical protein